MKKLIFSLICLSAATIASAGIIVTQNGTNIENVSKITVSSNEVSYIENGKNKSLPIDQITAVLYDDGRYEEIHVIPQPEPQPEPQPIQEVPAYNVNTQSNNSTVEFSAQSTGNYDPKQWNKAFAEDYNAFAKLHKDEIKIVSKAIMTVVYKQKGSIFNFGGAKSIDQFAMDAYVSAKMQGYSGEEAIRARNAVYITEAQRILDSKQKNKF